MLSNGYDWCMMFLNYKFPFEPWIRLSSLPVQSSREATRDQWHFASAMRQPFPIHFPLPVWPKTCGGCQVGHFTREAQSGPVSVLTLGARWGPVQVAHSRRCSIGHPALHRKFVCTHQSPVFPCISLTSSCSQCQFLVFSHASIPQTNLHCWQGSPKTNFNEDFWSSYFTIDHSYWPTREWLMMI